MDKRSFDAYWAVLCARWPWAKGTEIAMQEFRSELYAKVHQWSKDWEEAFKEAVWELKASNKFGMPSIKEIVGLAGSIANPKDAVLVDERAGMIRSRFRADYQDGKWKHGDSGAIICAVVGCSMSELRFMYGLDFWNIHCEDFDCNFGQCFVRCWARKTTDTTSEPHKTFWTDTDLWKVQCCACGGQFEVRVANPKAAGAKFIDPDPSDVALGTDPRLPHNQPKELMRGLLCWPPDGSMRKKVIGYLSEHHGIDAAHLLGVPRGVVLQSVDEVEAETTAEWLAERKANIVKATADYMAKQKG